MKRLRKQTLEAQNRPAPLPNGSLKKLLSRAVALARKVGVSEAEILETIRVSQKSEEKPQQKAAP
jgi:hypothetical protein